MTLSGADFRFGDHEAIRIVRNDDGKVERLFELVLQHCAVNTWNIGDGGLAGLRIDDAGNRQRDAAGCAAALVNDGFEAGGEVLETGFRRRYTRYGADIVRGMGNCALDGRSANIETNNHCSHSGTLGIIDFFS